jgi:hypothetical protein
MTAKKTNTAIDFAAEVITDRGVEPTTKQMREALVERLARLSDNELLEAIGVIDSFDFEEN